MRDSIRLGELVLSLYEYYLLHYCDSDLAQLACATAVTDVITKQERGEPVSTDPENFPKPSIIQLLAAQAQSHRPRV